MTQEPQNDANNPPWWHHKSPAALAHATTLTLQFLQHGRSERGKFIMPDEVFLCWRDSCPHPSIERAIHALDAHGVKANWTHDVRAKWVEMGLMYWEYRWRNGITKPFRDQHYRSDIRNGIDLSELPKAMTIADLGCRCYEMQDRYLHLLSSASDDDTVRAMMIKMIDRRTGFRHDNDPHRDVLARKLLLERYRLA